MVNRHMHHLCFSLSHFDFHEQQAVTWSLKWSASSPSPSSSPSSSSPSSSPSSSFDQLLSNLEQALDRLIAAHGMAGNSSNKELR